MHAMRRPVPIDTVLRAFTTRRWRVSTRDRGRALWGRDVGAPGAVRYLRAYLDWLREGPDREVLVELDRVPVAGFWS